MTKEQALQLLNKPIKDMTDAEKLQLKKAINIAAQIKRPVS